MKRRVIVRFHEIGLKGKNRAFFVRRLVENLRLATEDLGVERVWRGQMHVGLTLGPDASWPQVQARLQKVFGVVNFSLAHRTEPDLERIEGLLAREVPSRQFHSFRIATNRADKRFPGTSQEINRRLGTYVQKLRPCKVDLSHPDLTIYVEIQPHDAYVFMEKTPGAGGLPVDSGGAVVALLSSGIDSPVAAWHLMKRGCRVNFVHFHSYPLVDTRSMEKASELVERLTEWQYRSRLFLAPLAEVQKRVILSAPPAYRVILYRRFMVRIAEAIARREGALALVTGESVGQVSSQTLENIATVEAVTAMPILRPLIGTDKQEIIARARALGTYEVSIQPDQDCCSLFVPAHPVTRATPSELEDLEASLPVADLARQALEGVEERRFRYRAPAAEGV